MIEITKQGRTTLQSKYKPEDKIKFTCNFCVCEFTQTVKDANVNIVRFVSGEVFAERFCETCPNCNEMLYSTNVL